jgi:hypothetical protein
MSAAFLSFLNYRDGAERFREPGHEQLPSG